jgi:hypothetical protein
MAKRRDDAHRRRVGLAIQGAGKTIEGVAADAGSTLAIFEDRGERKLRFLD